MKVRAVANGNIYDRADVPESLIGTVFMPVEESAPAPVEEASPSGAPEPAAPATAPEPSPRPAKTSRRARRGR